MIDHTEHVPLAPSCGRHGNTYPQWGRASSPMDWGRLKFREVALLERMLHFDPSVHNHKETRRYYRLSDTERRFEQLFKQWHDETAHLSSTARVLSNQHYLTIVAMGQQALPAILRRLRDNQEPWLPALAAITRENPVKPEDVGEYQRMREAWLEWGSERGII